MTMDHLVYETTDRGFDHMPPIEGAYGGDVRAYESSSAMDPRIWLAVSVPVNRREPEGELVRAVVHLEAEDAWKLADQLRALVRDHYQGDAVPDWAEGESAE